MFSHRHIYTLIMAVLSLLAVCLLWPYNWMLFLVLMVLAVVMLWLEKQKKEVKLFVFCGLTGAVAEIIAIVAGAWTYANADLYNIPVWLPVLWGIAAVYMSRAYRSII